MVRHRQRKVIYSREKSQMEILFWNIYSFEQLQRKLIRWLDGDIHEGEKIRSIERHDALRGWVRVKNGSTEMTMS